jgi:hypothetical protein
MSANPLRREGGYWKPVLDYEPLDDDRQGSGYSGNGSSSVATREEHAVRHDLCNHCGSEFVVDSPFCRMCGHARGTEAPRPSKRSSQIFYFHQLCSRLGLSMLAMVCLIVGVVCLGAAITTGFIYTSSTLVDWQAIQIWRAEWLLAAGVVFLCGILLNGRKRSGS